MEYNRDFFKKLYELECQIIRCYSNLKSHPASLDIDPFRLVGMEINPIDLKVDRNLVELTKLVCKEQNILKRFKSDIPEVYDYFINQAKKRVESYENEGNIGFIKMNYTWKNYLINKRLTNQDYQRYIDILPKASFISHLKSISDNKLIDNQISVWLYTNPNIEKVALLIRTDKAILRELTGGVSYGLFGDDDIWKLKDEKQLFSNRIANEVLNNLMMACKRDKANPDLSVLTIAYLQACKQMCKKLYFDQVIDQTIGAIYNESERKGSKQFKKMVMEPIKKHI